LRPVSRRNISSFPGLLRIEVIRLFVALPVEGDRAALEEVHAQLVQWDAVLKNVPPENYHITLKFFGNCDDHLGNRIREAFSSLSMETGSIPFALEGLGTFPGGRRARVVWCGLRTETAAINRICRTVDRFATRLGFKEEKRDFVPHLTLARVRKGRELTGDIVHFIEQNRNTVFGKASFNRLVLFSSQLTPQGPRYTELAEMLFSNS